MADNLLNNDENKELIQGFIEDAADVLQRIQSAIRQLEDNPSDKSPLENLQGNLHTLRGMAEFLAIQDIEVLARAFEQSVTKLMHSAEPASQDLLQVYSQLFQTLEDLIDHFRQDEQVPKDITPLIQAINVETTYLTEAPLAEDTTPEEEAIPDSNPEQPDQKPSLLAPSSIILDMINSQLKDEDMQPLVETFIAETSEIIQHFEETLHRLNNEDLSSEIFERLSDQVSALKRTAGFLSLEQLSLLCSRLEQALIAWRDGLLVFDDHATDVLQQCLTRIKDHLQQVKDRHIEVVDLNKEVQALENIPFKQEEHEQHIEDEVYDSVETPGGDSFPEVEKQEVLDITLDDAIAETVHADQESVQPADDIQEGADITPKVSDVDAFNEQELLDTTNMEAENAEEMEPLADQAASSEDSMPMDFSDVDIPAAAYSPSQLILDDARSQLAMEDMQLIVDAFVDDGKKLFSNPEMPLSLLEDGAINMDLLEHLMEVVESIRSTSGFLSLEQVSMLAFTLSHSMEALLNGNATWTLAVGKALHISFHHLKNLMVEIEQRQLEKHDLSHVIYALLLIQVDGWHEEHMELLPAITSHEFATQEETPAPEEAPEPEDAVQEVVHPEGKTPPKAPEFTIGPDHPIYSSDMAEIVASFVVETAEVFDLLDNKLLDLEENYQDAELVNDIFRAVHTVKGSAGFLSLDQLSYLTHHFEDVLNRLRKGDIQFEPSMLDVMFDAFDNMKAMVQQVKDMELEVLEVDHIVKALWRISEGIYVPGGAENKAPAIPKEEVTTTLEASTSDPMPATDKKEAGRKGGSNKNKETNITETIRVEIDRLDSLMNLVGELVLSRNRLVQIIQDVGEHLKEQDEIQRNLADTSAQLDFITTELQAGVMHTRMVQMGRVFSKFPRVVRDLAKEAGKKIDLVIEGAETELDKSLTEEIGDPLVHLIRNACDHGVESPEVRLAAGKSEKGTVELSAQHEGNSIVIRIKDDGAGMDPEKLKSKAIEKGILTEKEAENMPDTEAFNLIFKAGFSTAKQLTKISGRGVGMDVVKTNITRMNGTISIQSELGKGSIIELKLPLTLAINQSLLIKQSSETFAIPLHSVVEVVSLESRKIDTIDGNEVIRLRERILPLVHISNVLGIENTKPKDQCFAVIVGLAHQRVGLVTDDLVGQKEIVIKPLGNYLKKIPGIAGSTILGDGRVIMILDIVELVRMVNERDVVSEQDAVLA